MNANINAKNNRKEDIAVVKSERTFKKYLPMELSSQETFCLEESSTSL